MSSSIPKCKLCLNTLWNYQPPDEASEETVQFWKDLVRIADENIGKIRQYNEKINFKVLDEPKCSLSKNHFPEDPYGREMKDPHKVWNVFEKRAIDRAAYLVNIPESWEEWEELEGLKNDSDDLKELQEDLNDEVGWDKWLEEFLKNDEEMMKKEQELRNKNKGVRHETEIRQSSQPSHEYIKCKACKKCAHCGRRYGAHYHGVQHHGAQHHGAQHHGAQHHGVQHHGPHHLGSHHLGTHRGGT